MEVKFNKTDGTLEIFATTPFESFELGKIDSEMESAGIKTEITDWNKSVGLKIEINK